MSIILACIAACKKLHASSVHVGYRQPCLSNENWLLCPNHKSHAVGDCCNRKSLPYAIKPHLRNCLRLHRTRRKSTESTVHIPTVHISQCTLLARCLLHLGTRSHLPPCSQTTCKNCITKRVSAKQILKAFQLMGGFVPTDPSLKVLIFS